jgi:hypothetical protein
MLRKLQPLRGGRGACSSVCVQKRRYPLLADCRFTLEADLNHAGWTGKLEAAGWDRQVLLQLRFAAIKTLRQSSRHPRNVRQSGSGASHARTEIIVRH